MSDQAQELQQQGKELHRAIDFGFQVEAFLQSDIGQYLVKRAEGQIDEAVEELKLAPADAPEVIRAIQTRIRVAENVQYWLAEAIQAGYAAQEELIERVN